MKPFFRYVVFALFISTLFTACSTKKEVKTIDYKTQQKNSKEALKEL